MPDRLGQSISTSDRDSDECDAEIDIEIRTSRRIEYMMVRARVKRPSPSVAPRSRDRTI
jgi:hypothetical protein